MKYFEVLIDDFLEKEICLGINENLIPGDSVIIDIENSLYSGHILNEIKNAKTMNKIIRKTTETDFIKINQNKNNSDEALIEAKKLSSKFNLNMHFVNCYWTFDRKQLYFSYVSEERIDFRKLAKSLADKYKTRIELRQIGVRDKAKKIGGIGPCGLSLCCNTFLTDFNSVSINMAKNQLLALNPTKINGVCGRLLCCLNYEDEVYSDLKKNAPKIGKIISTKKGKGKVTSVDILSQTCVVTINERDTLKINYNEENESIK